jgi:hypothetical protein
LFYKILFGLFVIISFSYSEDSSSAFVKEKIEIKELKKELNSFYNTGKKTINMLIMSENLLFFVNFLLIKNVGIINNT